MKPQASLSGTQGRSQDVHDLVTVQRRHPAAEHASGRQDTVAAFEVLQQRGGVDACRKRAPGEQRRCREGSGTGQEAAAGGQCDRVREVEHSVS